jgi:hypothetical protein
MKSFLISTGVFICLVGSSCSKNNSASQAGTAGEQDLTSSSLPSFVGIFSAPNAKFRIHSDGQFTLDTNEEMTSWHQGADQHSALCDVERTGNTQVIKKQHWGVGAYNIYLRLNISSRKILGSTQFNDDKDAPASVCQKAIDNFSGSPQLDLFVFAQGDHQFLIERDDDARHNGIPLEQGTRQDLHSDSFLRTEFSLLFTPAGKTTDVTDLVSQSLTGEFKENTSGKVEQYLKFSPEFKSFRFQDPACSIDQSVQYVVVSDGTHVLVQTPNTGAASSGSQEYLSNPCNFMKAQMGTGSQKIFEVTDLEAITGFGNYVSGATQYYSYFAKNY